MSATRLEIMEQVIDCEACSLSQHATPVFLTGNTPAKIAVIGDVPGDSEPFEGAAKDFLHAALTSAGFDLDETAFMTAIACRPTDKYGMENIQACSPNLSAQLSLTNPEFVLCLGAAALKAVKPDLSPKHGRSRVWMENDRLFMATVSVENAQANGNAQAILTEDLARFQQMIADEEGQWWSNLPITCGACGGEMVWMDETGLTWCFAHIPEAEKPTAEAWYLRQKAEMGAHSVQQGSKPSQPIDRNVTVVGANHPDTSQRAAQKALPNSGTVRRRVYDFVASREFGATDDEIEIALDKTHQSVSAARNTLMNDGWLVDSGEERMTRSNSPAKVWKAVHE